MYLRVFLILIFLLLQSCNESQQEKIVGEFVSNLLSESSKPVLADFYKYYGSSSELELSFEMQHCRQNGWTPESENESCIKYVNSRFHSADSVDSHFLNWLRKTIPLSPKFVIKEIKSHVGNGQLDHETILVAMGAHLVSFVRPINSSDIKAFGKLSISKIDGKEVDNLIRE